MSRGNEERHPPLDDFAARLLADDPPEVVCERVHEHTVPFKAQSRTAPLIAGQPLHA